MSRPSGPAAFGRFLEIGEEPARAVIEPGALLAGRYVVRRLVARGAIGEVYEAFDEELRERVALKTLRSELARDPRSLERFKREVQLARRVTHPNACRIFELGLHPEGDTLVPFLTMEFLEGETLAERLAHAPALTTSESLRLAEHIAAALSAVHVVDLVHRDLKPANVMLVPDGDRTRAVVMDFGLIRSGAADAQGTSGLYGTPDYMAPEQKAGEPVTPRSDVYSFGVVMAEMLGHANHPLVRRCLSTRAADRPASGTELLSALRPRSRRGAAWAAVGAGLLATVATSGVFQARRPPVIAPSVPAAQRIAVLPFENLGDPADAFLAAGIGDEVRGKLASAVGLEVIARNSSVTYSGTTKPLPQVARELGVRYVLTATVRTRPVGPGPGVEVRPELVEVRADGVAVSRWQRSFAVERPAVFELETRIASQVTGALGLAENAERFGRQPTRNVEAYAAYLRGEEITKHLRGDADLAGGVAAYEEAVAIDPSYGQAWGRLAQVNLRMYQVSPHFGAAALTAARRAVALAPDRPEGHLALGQYEASVNHDLPRALEHYARARRLDPQSTDVVEWAATAQMGLGQWENAVVDLQQTERLDPRQANGLLGRALAALGRYGESRAAYDRVLAVAPERNDLVDEKADTYLAQGNLQSARALYRAPAPFDHAELVVHVALFGDKVWALEPTDQDLLVRLSPSRFGDNRGNWALCLVQAYALRGDTTHVRLYGEEARVAFAARIRDYPTEPAERLYLALILGYLGQRAEALAEADRAIAMLPPTGFPAGRAYLWHLRARVELLAGDPDRAVEMIERTPDRHLGWMAPGILRIDPTFASLRSKPRFQRLTAGP